MGKKEGQKVKILRFLKSGGHLTPMDALRMFKCFRLAARIKDLRNEGYPVVTTMIKEGETEYASYHLPVRTL